MLEFHNNPAEDDDAGVFFFLINPKSFKKTPTGCHPCTKGAEAITKIIKPPRSLHHDEAAVKNEQ